jgi:hypothetical protein
MPIPSTTASFTNIQTELGGTNPISLSEYYNVTGKFGFGISGIPASGQISVNNFRGKSKPSQVSSSVWPPTAIETSYSGTYTSIPWGLGSTSEEWLSGASGTNLTRSGGSTFNNIGSLGAYRPNFVNYQNLILQAKPGDTIRLNANNYAIAGWTEVLTAFINFGSGYFSLGSQAFIQSGTAQWDYVIPQSTIAGNYGLLFYNSYNSAGTSAYTSANFYSLQISV